MNFEDDLQRRFESAHEFIEIPSGSTEEFRARAQRQTRNRRLAAGVVALLVVLGIGSLALRMPERNEAVVLEVASSPAARDGIITDADFDYLGAFMMPAGDWGDSRFAFGGQAATYFADGDPASDDGFGGSMFMSGHPTIRPGVAEVSIPAPMMHDGTTAGLPIADVLRPFTDVSGGRALTSVAAVEVGGTGEASGFRYSGLEVIDLPRGPRLAWTVWQYNNVAGNPVPSHGHSSVDLRDPEPQGPWFVGDYESRSTAGYIFDVPSTFADQHLAGYRLITGLQDRSASGDTSWGPPFFAFNAPPAAEPGDRTPALALAFYDGEAQSLADFGRVDTGGGAEWISTPSGDEAVIVVGSRGLGEVHWGTPRANDCGTDSGSHAGPYEPQVLFYGTDDLARVASGELEQWQLEPYQRWNPAEFLIPTCDWQLSAVSFDERSGRLYIVQREADVSQSEFSPVPVVHVFSLSQ